MDWAAKLEWAEDEHAARARRPAGAGEREDFRLASIAGASWAAGLAALMLGRHDLARERLVKAADEYRVSREVAPPGSWGRPIAALRCRLIAGDAEGARADAFAALDAGAAEAAGPIAAYCTCLALLVLGRDDEAAGAAAALAGRDDFQPAAVARALVAVARRDDLAYADAAADVLYSFESRDAFLEDMPVADTVLVLDALARPRGIPAGATTSPLLPALG
jgi:hypothetical protein